MIRIFKTEDGAMHEKEEMQPGCWIALTNPTASEIIDIADTYQIDPQGCVDYGLPGGDPCAHFLYGRKGEGFPHLHENQVYPADSL